MIKRHKYLIVLLAFSFCLFPFALSNAQQLQWYIHYSTGDPFEQLYDLHFVNENYGWLVGWDSPGGKFLMTKDGGSSWIEVTDSAWYHYEITSVFFVDTLIGWILTSDRKLLKTSDGGYNWIEIAQLNTAPPYLVYGDLYFRNHLEGWAVGGDITVHSSSRQETGFIKHTTDGGNTWLLVDDDTTVVKTNICFSDSLHGLVVGFPRSISISQDGGLTWNLNSGFDPGYIFNGCDYLNDSSFVVVGYKMVSTTSYPLLGKSTDWGQNWNFTVWQTSQVEAFRCVDFNDEQQGWLGSGEGQFIYTDNGGQSFQIHNTNFNYAIRAIQMIREDLGWATGAGFGTIFKYGIPLGIQPYLNQKVSQEFYLYQNYPNPFNSTTQITFKLFKPDFVNLTIYNIQGERVIKLISETRPEGNYTITWNGTDQNYQLVSSGIYLASIHTQNSQQTIKMLYLK